MFMYNCTLTTSESRVTWLLIALCILLAGCGSLPHRRRAIYLSGNALPKELQSVIAKKIAGPIEDWYVTCDFGYPDKYSDRVEATFRDQNCVVVVRGKKYLVSSESGCFGALREAMSHSLLLLDADAPDSVTATATKIHSLLIGRCGVVLVTRNKASFDLSWARGSPKKLMELQAFCEDPVMSKPAQSNTCILTYYSMNLKGGIEHWAVKLGTGANGERVIETVRSRKMVPNGTYFTQWG